MHSNAEASFVAIALYSASAFALSPPVLDVEDQACAAVLIGLGTIVEVRTVRLSADCN